MVTLTWHVCKYKVHTLQQRCVLIIIIIMAMSKSSHFEITLSVSQWQFTQYGKSRTTEERQKCKLRQRITREQRIRLRAEDYMEDRGLHEG